MKPVRAEGGFTLVEVIIALALFALIGMAGVALVEAVIGAQDRTHARLDRIAEIRRANYIIGLDLDQIEPGGFAGSASGLQFRRHGFLGAQPVGQVRYSLASGALQRRVDNGPAQPLLSGVSRARWRYHSAGRGWIDAWAGPAKLPDGVAIDVTLTSDGKGPTGTFRRIVVLPRPS